MSPDLLFGMETEYAFSQLREAEGEGGISLPRGAALSEMLAIAHQRFECLRDIAAPGVYFANGSRFYIDTGNHPELSTPECSDPAELVLYQRAGERILSELAAALDAGHPGTRASFFRCNVDYESAETWGCHESYLYTQRKGAMATELLPHLVSRLVYTGAGGFDDRSPGISFILSPRVSHLVRVISSSSTGRRGIFHTKDEPLGEGGHHRLHLICGESLSTALGSYLKVGATALVVRLIEAGLCDGQAMELLAPLTAMQEIAADPTCSRRVRLRSGREIGAIEIQRHYLSAAERSLARSCMPAWAGEVCRRWREVLDLLEGRGEEVAGSFDWAIKLELFRGRAAKRGFRAADIERCNAAMGAVQRKLDGLADSPLLPRSGERLLEAGLASGRRGALLEELSSRGIGLDRLRAFLALRAELFEIDVRFGQLGGGGIFDIMDRSGAVEHGAPDPHRVVAAMREPPARGRARERGLAIRRCRAAGRNCSADWQGILDHDARRVFEMRDPFGRGAAWREWKDCDRGSLGDAGSDPRASLLRRLVRSRRRTEVSR